MRLGRAIRLAALAASIAVVIGATLSPSLRHLATALVGDETSNDLVSLYTAISEREANTADLVPIQNVDVNPYGVNVFLEQEVEEWKIRRTLEMAKDAGFHWIKQQVRWTEIEIPAKGEYYDTKNDVTNTWAKYDRIVELARGYGLDLILRLDTSPEWARSVSKEETPPLRLEDYGDFVASVVQRYKGKVRYYQIWNEPNLTFEWGGEQPDPREYVSMLRAAYLRAKEADPDAMIIAAALAPTVEVSERAVNDLIYLKQMYDAGAGQWFDILAANPYGLRSGPDDRRLGDGSDVNFSRPVLMREMMVRNGDAAKPIWASEMGWNALPLDFPGEAPWGRVTREQQARYTVRAYQRMREEWPWMGVAALWHFRMVHDVNRDQAMYYFGIVDNDFTPYPAYEAIRRLSAAEPALYPGYHGSGSSAITLGSGWAARDDLSTPSGSTKLSDSPGATVRFPFYGSDLDVVAEKGPRAGRLLVKIDGQGYAANRLPRVGGVAELDLSSPENVPLQRIAVARGLSWGQHVVEMETAGGEAGSTVIVGGFVVGGSPPNAPRTIVLFAIPLVVLLLLRLTGRPLWRVLVVLSRWVGYCGRVTAPASRIALVASRTSVAVLRSVAVLIAHALKLLWSDESIGRVEGLLGRGSVVPAFGIAILGAWGLRLLRLDGQSLWYDEGTTAALATRTIAMITRDAAGDIHPPLYYYLVHYWAGLAGTSEFSLRLLSVMYGLLAVAIVYKLGSMVAGREIGVVGALLAAVSPLLIYYSQEARMYAQLALLAGLSIWALLRLLDQSCRRRRLTLAAYGVVTAAMLYTHYFAVTVLAAEVMYVALYSLRHRHAEQQSGASAGSFGRLVTAWLATTGLAVGSFVPWLLVAGNQLAGWPAISAPVSLPVLLQRVFRVFIFGVGSEASLTPKRELALLAVAAIGLLYLLRMLLARPGKVTALLLFAATPVLAMYVLSLQRPMYNPKFLLPAALPFAILMAAGVIGGTSLAAGLISRTRLWLGGTQLTTIALAVFVLGVAVYPAKSSLQAYYFDPKYARDDYRGLAAYVAANSAASDAIILNAPGQAEIFDYYYRGTLDEYPLPRQRPVDLATTSSDLSTIAGEHGAVWLVLWATSESDPEASIERWLDARALKQMDRPYGSIRLLKYEIPGKGK